MCEQCFQTYQTSSVSTTCYTFGWDKCNMCLIYMNFLKKRCFIAFCTVTKYAGETCTIGMSFYTLKVWWMFQCLLALRFKLNVKSVY